MSYDFSNRFRKLGISDTYVFLGDERIWLERYTNTYEVFFEGDHDIQICCANLQDAFKQAIILNSKINPSKGL